MAGNSTLPVSGLAGDLQTATLITGDQITVTRVTAGNDGRAEIRADAAPRPDGSNPAITVIADRTTSGADQITASPQDAQPYIQAGSVDRGLFDVEYLATHEASGRLPVIVQYADPMTASELASNASNLPASTLVQTLDSSNAADVNVDLKEASKFWAAITGHAGPTQSAPTQALAGGIAKIWLKDHTVAANTTPPTPASEPLYTVTETIDEHANSTVQKGCGGGVGRERSGTICYVESSITALDGSAAGRRYEPTTRSCVQQVGPCRTVRRTFVVPAGQYSVRNSAGFELVNQTQQGIQWVHFDNPQFRVANDTQIAFDLDDAKKITINAPQPTEPYRGWLQKTRLLPDGTGPSSVTFTPYPNFWAVPTTAPVTIGSYDLKTNWVLGHSLISAAVTDPEKLQLHAIYSGTSGYNLRSSVRFAGKQSLTLVDAGFGSSDDFAGIDARGKLALMRPRRCVVVRDQLQNALQAGAAGVLIDPTDGDSGFGICRLPIDPDWASDGGDRVAMPFAEIPATEAAKLRSLMSRGLVTVAVNDYGDSPYAYHLTLVQEGRIPNSLQYNITTRQLARLDTNYHSAQPAVFQQLFSSWLPDEYFTGADGNQFAGPATRQVYWGPIRPDIVYPRQVRSFTSDGSAELSRSNTLSLFSKAGNLGTENWADQPTVPGSPAQPTDVMQAQPGRFARFPSSPFICSACRQGDVFLPWTQLASSAPRHSGSLAGGWWAGQKPGTVHLYQAGQEVPPMDNPYGSGYTLPADQAQYRLTMDENNSHTSWDFSSAQPTTDPLPGEYTCIFHKASGGVGHCEPVPLIFLRYNAGVDLHNAVTAPGGHRVQISAYHQDPNGPAISSLKAWTSTDGGTSWQPAGLTSQGGGVYTARYTVPSLAATSGTVSLKVQAQDADGNDVTQVITDAYALAGAATRSR